MAERLTIRQMPDSWVYSKLAETSERMEYIVGNVNMHLSRNDAEQYAELKAEALKRLSA